MDDVLLVTKGTKQEHLVNVREVMKTLGKADLQLKCTNSKDSFGWNQT